MKTELIESKVLIANRKPPGDRWQLADEPEGKIYKSITDTLEAYMHKTGFRGHYRLEPLQSRLYAIKKQPNTPNTCLLYTSPSPRDRTRSRMPSSA